MTYENNNFDTMLLHTYRRSIYYFQINSFLECLTLHFTHFNLHLYFKISFDEYLTFATSRVTFRDSYTRIYVRDALSNISKIHTHRARAIAKKNIDIICLSSEILANLCIIRALVQEQSLNVRGCLPSPPPSLLEYTT